VSATPSSVTIVGLDCATQPSSVGLACARFEHQRLELLDVAQKTTWPSIDETVGTWLSETTLLAIDAPLGWPRTFSRALQRHRAGEALAPESANQLFRRATDDVVARTLHKRPLDVGADRIARTAHVALGFVQRLREARGRAIPLAWKPGQPDVTSAIEVYPAGTLASRTLPSSRYKGATQEARTVRAEILGALDKELAVEDDVAEAAIASDHVLDVILCCVAGVDFVQGDVIYPTDLDLAKHEGWIWVRPPR